MVTQTETELHVIKVLDGRPGHEKQTNGIVQALQQIVRIRTSSVSLEKHSIYKTFLHTCGLFLPLATKAWGVPGAEKADLLIGTGSHTHLPMLHAKQQTGIPVVTCMSPSIYLLNRFDLCFIPAHDSTKEASNIIYTTGAPNMSKNLGVHKKDQGLILLGGIDKKSHHWDGKKIVAMVENLVQKYEQMHWTLSSSPRTPTATIKLLQNLAEKYPKVHFFDYRDTPAGWVEKMYDESSIVWVTSDSISMIYEALTAGCRVGILPMDWRRKNCKFRRNETMLVSKGLVKSFSEREQLHVEGSDIGELNEAQRCARIIAEKWWPNSLL